MRDTVIKPVKQPSAKTNITNNLSNAKVVKAGFKVSLMMKVYIPKSSKIKLPEIPGKIKAEMARTPQKKTKNKLCDGIA